MEPTAVFLPGEFHGQKSLVGYSPWGSKESDMTEPLNNYMDRVGAWPCDKHTEFIRGTL